MQTLDDTKIDIATSALQQSLHVENLKGRTFVDVGCGSGLFSLSAFRLDAEKVVSFDINPSSVRSCESLWSLSLKPANWQLMEGSILDSKFLSQLGRFDVVYSYGVLHHTGKMWEALRNAIGLVKENGIIFFAIYNKVDGLLGSSLWRRIKWLYNSSDELGRGAIVLLYTVGTFARAIAMTQNPSRLVHKNQRRGMDFWTDVRDWVGGYPYEYASLEEIERYMQKQPEFELIYGRRAVRALANNEFLYRLAVPPTFH